MPLSVLSALSSAYNKYKLIILIILIFSLTTCATNNIIIIPEKQRAVTWENNRQNILKLKYQSNWSILARVGLISKQGSSSSQLDWVTKNNNNYKITLNNALTYGVIVINKNSNNVTLEYQHKIYQAKTPDTLLSKLTNLNLPVAQLEYWILGLPSPNLGIDKIELNDYAVPARLQQSGYTISYSDHSLTNNYLLPNKIIITAPGLHIKIIVQNWQI